MFTRKILGICLILALCYMSITFSERITVMNSGIHIRFVTGSYWSYSVRCALGQSYRFDPRVDTSQSHWSVATTGWTNTKTDQREYSTTDQFKLTLDTNMIIFDINTTPSTGIPDNVRHISTINDIYLSLYKPYYPLVHYNDIKCYTKVENTKDWISIPFTYHSNDQGFTNFSVSLIDAVIPPYKRTFKTLDALTVSGLDRDITSQNPLVMTISMFDKRVPVGSYLFTYPDQIACHYDKSTPIKISPTKNGELYLTPPDGKSIPRGSDFVMRCRQVTLSLDGHDKAFFDNSNSLSFAFGYTSQGPSEHQNKTYFVYNRV